MRRQCDDGSRSKPFKGVQCELFNGDQSIAAIERF
jgi:hypothetical protein